MSDEPRQVSCAYTGDATTKPAPPVFAFFAHKPANTASTASVSTAETDSDPSNNSTKTPIEITMKPGPKPDPKPEPKPDPKAGKIAGRIWNDTNRNGVQDKNEKGVPGVKLLLWGGPSEIDDSRGRWAVSDRQGFYSFDNVVQAAGKGQYSLAAGAPDRTWAWTEPEKADGVLIAAFTDAPFIKQFRKGQPLAHASVSSAPGVYRIDGPLVGREAAAPTLPVTGAGTTALAGLGALLAFGGGGLVLAARRRRGGVNAA